jgi:hypothetical protein
MSETYEIEALRKKDDTLELSVTIVHPDVDELPETKNFVLQLLVDAGDRKGPLNQVISMDERLNETWLKTNAHRFIRSVKILRTKNHPRGGAAALPDDDGGDEPLDEAQPNAVYRANVVDAKHIAKIKPGLKWSTAAYDVGRDVEPK